MLVIEVLCEIIGFTAFCFTPDKTFYLDSGLTWAQAGMLTHISSA